MASLDEQFHNFAKFGDTKADGKTITLTQIDKWLKQAGVFDKKLTTTDTGICFGKLKKKKTMGAVAPAPIKLDVQFVNFAKYGSVKSDGKEILLSQIDKWFKQAEVFEKRLTMTDTGVLFNKFKSKTINYNNFLAFLEDLANSKNIPVDNIKEKLMNCGAPGTNKATTAVKTGAVDRLTDTSKYTGSHKERFDESGHGKGAEGRTDRQDDSGYVGNYKGQGTYDQK